MSRYLRLSLACLLFSIIPLATVGQVQVSADTYASDVSPSTNYGSAPILAVQQGTTAYIRFDLSSLPADLVISKVVLRLHVNSVLAPGDFDAYEVNDTWSEDTLNYNNAPRLGPSATGGNPISIWGRNGFVELDVTRLAQAWVTGAIPNNGLAIALPSGSATSQGIFAFNSKESTLNEYRPELVFLCPEASARVGLEPGPQVWACKFVPRSLCCLCKDLLLCHDENPPATRKQAADVLGDCITLCTGHGGYTLTSSAQCYIP